MFETSFSPVTPESAETLLSAYPAFGSGDCNLTAVSLISRAAARKARFAVIEGIPVVRWHPTGRSGLCRSCLRRKNEACFGASLGRSAASV